MAKFVNSEQSILSSLLLWNDKPTQVSVQETYNHKVWPSSNILNDGPINFTIPPQPKGMMRDINIVTTFKIQADGKDIVETQKSLSVVNNFANSLWSLVKVTLDDRVDIMQSMKNSYPYTTFFNHALNSGSDREDYLLYNELFCMDTGGKKENVNVNATSKSQPEALNYLLHMLGKMKTNAKKDANVALNDTVVEWLKTVPANSIFNEGAQYRSERVKDGQTVKLSSKLQVPLFNTSKCLPTNMKIRISLVKNSDDFLLFSNQDSTFNVSLLDVYLDVEYFRPRDAILQVIEDRLQKEPAPYFVSRPEIIIKPIPNATKIIRLNDIFHDKIPPYVFCCLQKSIDFEGKRSTNPFTFIPFKKFQFYVNGLPYFTNALELTDIKDGVSYGFGEYLQQLYRTVGKDLKGNCLINSKNFGSHFMVGISFGADKSSTVDKHLNLQENASTYVEIDMGINESDVPEDMLFIAYAVYDRQIQIDGNRSIRIIE